MFTINLLFLDPLSSADGKGSLAAEATDPGLVAGIVIGVVSLGLLLLALVAVLCYRHYLHRNVTSMNFDNPVYRKTTEDQFSLEKNRFPLPTATVGEEVKLFNLMFLVFLNFRESLSFSLYLNLFIFIFYEHYKYKI